ncbi:MAG: RNA polymerase sigma factor [Planctomycetaceae bacterium]|nr:RNA polymerase sigma factor [Planctomycetaceae bacterium]
MAASDPSSEAESDQRELEQQLGQHQGWLRSVIQARLGGPEGTDDILQEVQMAAIEGHVSLRKSHSFSAWLYQIAVRQTALFRRQLGRHRRRLRQAGEKARIEINDCPEPLDYLMKTERQEIILQALQQIPPQDREMLVLKYVEGWSYRSIADQLNRTERGVESQLQRARQRLRRRLLATDLIDQQKAES